MDWRYFDEESDKGHYLEVDVQYTENYMNLIMIYQFLLERTKIENIEKLVANFHNETEYIIHIRNLKQTLN